MRHLYLNCAVQLGQRSLSSCAAAHIWVWLCLAGHETWGAMSWHPDACRGSGRHPPLDSGPMQDSLIMSAPV